MNWVNAHYLEPDYSKPPFKIPQRFRKRFIAKLRYLYGRKCDRKCYRELLRLLQVYYAYKTPELIEWEQSFRPEERITEKDAILITYGDLIRDGHQKPLQILEELSNQYLHNAFNTIHILPFFPSSSDRGFAVIDFDEVDHQLGTWDDILDLKANFKIMFDGVFNHVSSKSRWFQRFLNQNPEYLDYFTVFSTQTELKPDHLKLIMRPRTTGLLTRFETLYGARLVWTTFSPDQIDLNYHNPKILLKMVEILLTYVRRGADFIRLDAVTYLWEELGTSCVHLKQSHTIIKLFRDILDCVAPYVTLITETNVSHADNVRYFGNGFNEAQMIYNFALPPLVLHAFITGNSSRLTQWASGLKRKSSCATYFNFLDSHDGIGLMAVKDILSPGEINMLALEVVERGGYISYRSEGDQRVSPYELNITWFSAINNENNDEPGIFQVQRYMASRVIALVLMGVPGIYLHGLLGSKNDTELVLAEKQTRSINRKNIIREELIKSLNTTTSTTFMITSRLIRLLRRRRKEKSFHPNAGQKVINISEKLFCVLRTSIDETEKILTIVNISAQLQKVRFNLPSAQIYEKYWLDLMSRQSFQFEDGRLNLELEPYEFVWLKPRLPRSY